MNVQRLFQAFRPPVKLPFWTETLPKAWSKTAGLGVGCFLGLLVALPAQAQVEMRVAIRDGVSEVSLGSSTPAVVRDGTGRTLGQLSPGQAYAATLSVNQVTMGQWQAPTLWIEPTNNGYVFIGDSWYRGRARVLSSNGSLTAVNYVDLEHYLYSVLGGEMPTSWPLEALQAQAVAARTYALYQRQTGANATFDVGTTTSWQVYGGLADEAQSTHLAVDSTRGQVLTYNGQIIQAVFHSSSGGHTENVEDVWSRPLPYLRGVQDYDAGAPVYQWSKTFSQDEFSNLVWGVGYLISAVPERTTPQGRVVSIRLNGTDGSRVLSGSDLRSALGLRSTLFSISVAGDQVQVYGRGYGHGIGLSQWGARNMASQGYGYQQILSHYYQGSTLARIEAR